MSTTGSTILYLNVYSISRHYGGPEEGGWWYDAGEPLASVPIVAQLVRYRRDEDPHTPKGYNDLEVLPEGYEHHECEIHDLGMDSAKAWDGCTCVPRLIAFYEVATVNAEMDRLIKLFRDQGYGRDVRVHVEAHIGAAWPVGRQSYE